ncbi:MAG: LarC family nickel insertion protein, partial [Akkermansiaceae bacterium]|nr:LarC family nickel insertion protein [Akkermansiaceae bacterium]
EEIVFEESSTLGVRRSEVQRDSLPRRIETIKTRFGDIRVKVATLPSGQTKVYPEFEDCRQAARHANRPVREVFKFVEHEAAHALQLPHSH